MENEVRKSSIDGAEGAVIAWGDVDSVRVQRIHSNGSIQWSPDA